MSIPDWIINTFNILVIFTSWLLIAAFVGVKLGKFMKDDSHE